MEEEEPKYKLAPDGVMKAKLEKILAGGSYQEIIKQWTPSHNSFPNS